MLRFIKNKLWSDTQSNRQEADGSTNTRRAASNDLGKNSVTEVPQISKTIIPLAQQY